MFHKKNFCHVSSTNRGCPQYSIYVYKTTDSVETMLTEGYFNEALLDLNRNDVIIAEIISEIDNEQFALAFFRVESRTLDSVTVERTIIDKDVLDNLYIQKTGDTMTGALTFKQAAGASNIIMTSLDEKNKAAINLTSPSGLCISFDNTPSWYILPNSISGDSSTVQLGTQFYKFLSVYTRHLNNGQNIDVPTVGGTLTLNEVNFQTPITDTNKGATMAELTPVIRDIEALQGAGGALNASNFNTATPTQETLTKYAVDQIWPGNTNWAWNAANPAASTFTSADGVSRTAAEIFNSTWVNNTYDDHRWQLTNTQNTTPKVFEWADVGRDIVAVATATTAGIVRVGDGSQMVVNASTGDISLDRTKAAAIRTTIDAPGLNVENTFSAVYQSFKLTNLNFSTTVATAQYAGINFADASGTRLGVVELSQQTDNTKRMSVGLVGSTIRLELTSDGVATHRLSENPPSDSSSTQIATTQWVRGLITEQMGGDFVQYWDASDNVSTDHSHAKPGISTPTNNRWYRYYKSGWVVQGGNEVLSNGVVVTFPVRMRNTNYLLLPGGFAIPNSGRLIVSKTATNFSCSIDGYATEFTGWVIMGYAGV